jgi:GntR family transcriptional repressor for pyruvate dehydrogenase complex
MTPFHPFDRPENLADAVALQIRMRIVSGEFAPQQKLPTEMDLAARFKVSRNVVREAIARLKLNGLIDTRRGVGSFVAADIHAKRFEVMPADLLDENQLRQILELRVEIEEGAAALAAIHRTDEQLAMLRKTLSNVDGAAHDWELGASAAFRFHLAVAQCSNNQYFVQLMEHLSHSLHSAVRTLRYTASRRERVDEIEQEHHAIVAAIEAQDPQAARSAMRAHLTRAYDEFNHSQRRNQT